MSARLGHLFQVTDQRGRSPDGFVEAWRRAGLAAACAVLPFAASVDAASANEGGCGRPVQRARLHQERDRGRRRGVAALQAVGSGRRQFDVSAPATRASSPMRALTPYSAVVFLNTAGDLLDDAQRRALRDVLQEGRRLRRHRLGDRDRPALGVPDQHPRHPRLGRTDGRRPARSRSSTASTTRARTCREYWDRTDPCYNFTTNVRGVSHVLATVVEDPFEPAAAGQHADGHRRRHDGRQPPGLLLQGLPGRPLVLHRRSATRRRLRRRR